MSRWLGFVILVGCAPPTATPPGSFTRTDFLQGDTFTRLGIEVDRTTTEPLIDDVVKGRVQQLIDDLSIDKPDGLAVFPDQEPAPAAGVRTRANVEALVGELRTLTTAADTAVIHAVILDGRFEEEGVLSFTVGDDAFVVLSGEVDAACTAQTIHTPPAPPAIDPVCQGAFDAAVLHQLGHLFGLVNDGTPMGGDHEDEASAHHDVNPGCVMHASYEGADGVDAIATNVEAGVGDFGVPEFDEPCQDDLAAAF